MKSIPVCLQNGFAVIFKYHLFCLTVSNYTGTVMLPWGFFCVCSVILIVLLCSWQLLWVSVLVLQGGAPRTALLYNLREQKARLPFADRQKKVKLLRFMESFWLL